MVASDDIQSQSFAGWPVQLHTKGRDPTAKGERNGGRDNKKQNTNALIEKKLGKLKKKSSKLLKTPHDLSATGRNHGDLLAGWEEGGGEGRLKVDGDDKDKGDKTRTRSTIG